MIKKFGFVKNPFSKYSAEEELEFLNEIFYKPNYYDTLLDDLKSSSSRFILGQRGHGKSSLIHHLKNDLEKDKVFAIIIDKYDGIPITDNDIAIVELIIKSIIKKISIFLLKNKIKVSSLDKVEKDKLSLYINFFFETISRKEFEIVYNKIHRVKIKNFFIRAYNRFFSKKLNLLSNTAINISSSFITDSLGLSKAENLPFREYFKELDEISIQKKNIKETNIYTYDSLKTILTDLVDIIKNLEFNNTVILFDKIDEFKALNQDLLNIANFTRGILTDTELLLQNNLAIAFSLWTEIKYLLNSSGVRFDKFKEIDVSWSAEDLEKIINKRLQYFSENKDYSIDVLVKDKNDKSEILEISNRSPRDLIRVLSLIYDVQVNKNIEAPFFEPSNIVKGMINYAQGYDYLSISPSKIGNNQDVIPMIKRLLLVRQIDLDVMLMNKALNQKTRVSVKYIGKMMQYNLIQESMVSSYSDDSKSYIIVDPKLKFLIKRNITSLGNN